MHRDVWYKVEHQEITQQVDALQHLMMKVRKVLLQKNPLQQIIPQIKSKKKLLCLINHNYNLLSLCNMCTFFPSFPS